MQIIGNSHLIAGTDTAIEPLLVFLESEGFDVRANPDVYVRTYQTFGIEEALELRDRAKSKALGDSRRIFTCAMPSMTSEAQNALLKTLEEPGDALFFFIVPAPEMLLATVRSRMQILQLDSKASQGTIDPQRFLNAKPADRLEMLKPLLEKGDDDKRDIGSIITFLSSLENIMAKDAKSARAGIEAIYRARKYASDKGSLIKPLLEHVALLA